MAEDPKRLQRRIQAHQRKLATLQHTIRGLKIALSDPDLLPSKRCYLTKKLTKAKENLATTESMGDELPPD